MDDRRAHDRIDTLEETVKAHIEGHVKFEKALAENTILTQQIANNTAEIVDLVKGAKGLRTFVVWAAPIVAASLATWALIKGH